MAAGVSEYIERVETDGGEVESDIYVSESVEDLGDFFDDASLVTIPTAYKATKLYSIKPTDGSGDFTFSRSTTGTRVNESGLIEKNIGVNVPRIDYSSGTPSLLLEPQKTNFLPQSENFNSYSIFIIGTGVNPVLTSNYGISPEGLINAVRIQFDAGTNGISSIRQYVNVGSNPHTATKSIYIKSLNGNVSLNLGDGLTGAEKIDVTTEWQRFQVTDTIPSSTHGFHLMTNTAAGNPITSQVADVLVYGAQIEVGSYATSYIPTSGASVTRVIDAITNSVSYALSTGYTIFIELQTQSLTVSNDIEFKDASNNYVFRVGDEVIVGAGLFTQANTTGYNKFALQVDSAGNYELFKNGSSVTSGSGIAHDIEVISSVAGQDVRQILVFEQALTDAECINLTTV